MTPAEPSDEMVAAVERVFTTDPLTSTTGLARAAALAVLRVLAADYGMPVAPVPNDERLLAALWSCTSLDVGHVHDALRAAGFIHVSQIPGEPVDVGEWVAAACGCVWRESRPAGFKLNPAMPRVCTRHTADHPASLCPSPQGMATVAVTYHRERPR